MTYLGRGLPEACELEEERFLNSILSRVSARAGLVPYPAVMGWVTVSFAGDRRLSHLENYPARSSISAKEGGPG